MAEIITIYAADGSKVIINTDHPLFDKFRQQYPLDAAPADTKKGHNEIVKKPAGKK